jgi:hypothetical protein
MEKYVSRERSLLDKLANQRDAATAKLKALTKKWTDERNSVASNIMQGGSIVMQGGLNGMSLSAGDVLSNLQDKVQQAEAFAANLRKLKAMGLSSGLLSQIAAAGVDQGSETASALASASAGQIAQMNQMQKGLSAAANQTGGVVADAMYGAGVDSAKGLIKGLQSQQKAIEKHMLKIALAMKNAIKHALGIRSPSRVMHELGGFIAQGLANGIDAGSAMAAAASGRLAGAVVAGASGVGAPGPRMALIGHGGGTVHNHVHVTVQGSVRSDRDLRDVVQQEVLKLNARNRSNGLTFKR